MFAEAAQIRAGVVCNSKLSVALHDFELFQSDLPIASYQLS
jgi:hypothetical protein